MGEQEQYCCHGVALARARHVGPQQGIEVLADVAFVGKKPTGYQGTSITAANTLLMMPMQHTGSNRLR
ncbi:MAG: hypothetical protein EAX95_02105 [Candidatus Thorarchaeota archaeon]|nr:hypothetical protein [Candidatus Thorarchaeota archaeon]